MWHGGSGMPTQPGDTVFVVPLPAPPAGFDVAVAAEACAAANISCDFVPIANVADRIPSLQNGTVDILAAALVYTPEREALVQYVRPFYYASGTSLRALEANAAGLASRGGWEAIRGQPVCTVVGDRRGPLPRLAACAAAATRRGRRRACPAPLAPQPAKGSAARAHPVPHGAWHDAGRPLP